ncbi:MAG: helix-turn-helix transcriptional regulator [Bacteroidetes bacterium]|nr:helix-turn-helix transcriptional regulator [Bacteroidota bacterium]
MSKETGKIKHIMVRDKAFTGYGNPPTIDVFESELDAESMAALVKALRKHKKLTQKQLSRLIGVEKSEISKLERGDRNLTLGRLVQLFDAMVVTTKLRVEIRDNENKETT